MAYTVALPDGRTVQFPDDVPQEKAAEILRQQFPAPAPSTERTWGEAIKDVPASLLTGAGSLLQAPGQLVKLVPGLKGVGEALEAPGEAVQKFGTDLKSTGLKAREALRSQAMSEAEKEGVLSEFATAITSTLKDPALITSFITEQVPMLLGPLGAARLTTKLGMGAVEGAAAGAAREAAAAKLGQRATTAAIGTGTAMQAGDVSGETYTNTLKRALEMGMSQQEAEDAALNAARIAAAGAGAVSLGANLGLSKIGGAAIERRLAGLPGKGRVQSGIGEATSETLDEAGGQIFQNIGVRTVDPSQSLTAGVGGAAAMGALGGGFFGSMLGKRPDADLAPGQRPGETLQQTATRLNAQIGALTEQAKDFDADQTRTQAGLMTNTQLIDMYRDQGYGAVKQYQQQLVAQASDPNVPPEQKAAARQAAQQIEDLFKQVSAEEVSRQMPSEVSYKITDKDLTRFDIKGSDPLYKAAFGKDISDPVQAQSVLDAIEVELNRKGIRQTQAARLMFFKDALDRVLETLPAGGLYVPPTVQQPSGAGAGVAGVPGIDTTTAGPGAAKPSGVVPPEPDVEQPVSRKAEPTAPITEEAVTPQKAEKVWKTQPDFVLAEHPIDAEILNLRRIKDVSDRQKVDLDIEGMASDALKASGRLQEVFEEAPTPAKPAAPVAPTVAVTPALPSLPKDLALAKPRYAYGEKQFQLKFNSDIDKALYITAQKTPSKRDADYRSWLETQGFTPDQIAQGGQQVRDAIKGIAKTAKPEAGPINLPAQTKKPKRSLAPEVEKKLEPIYKDLERRAKVPKQEKPAAEVKEAPKEKTQKDVILEQRAELIKQLDGILKKILAKYNLTGVKLDLDESMADEGSYGAQVIKLALNVDSPVRVLRHEAIHALKDMGFFSDAQWKTLVKKAQDEWVQKYLKDREHNATQSRYDAYVELLTKEGNTPAEVQEAIIEEAIADAFGDFDVNGATPGLMASILKRMQNLFKAIKEAFGVAGIDTAEEIFGKIEKGSLKPAIPMGKEKAPEKAEEVKQKPVEKEQAEKKSLRSAPDTPEFKRWTRDFPIIPASNTKEYKGGPAVFQAYHGTTHDDIIEFRSDVGSQEGSLGQGPYFSTSAEDVSENYAGVGPDLTARIGRETERVSDNFYDDAYYATEVLEDYFSDNKIDAEVTDDNFDELKSEYGEKAVEHAATKALKGKSEGLVMPTWVRLEKPFDMRGDQGTMFFLEYPVDENGETNFEAELTGNADDLIKAIQEIGSQYNADVDGLTDFIYEEALGGVSAKSVFDQAKKEVNDLYDDNGDLISSGQFVQDVARELGFDGFIQDAYAEFGLRKGFGGIRLPGMKGVKEDTLHIMPFNSVQVKSATGNVGTYGEVKDIRKSLRSQSPEFKFWFGQSKIVDEDGKPKVMYHGTARDITEFKPKQAGAIFVTDQPDFAENFSRSSATWMAEHADQFLTPQQLEAGRKAAIKTINVDYKADKVLAKKIIDAIDDPKSMYRSEAVEILGNQYKKDLPSGPNLMPVFVKAEYPFDFNDPKHRKQLARKVRADSFTGTLFLTNGSMLRISNIESSLESGSWEIIEQDDVQEAIRSLGFDGFYIKEHGVKNLAVYSPNQITSATGNVGAYGQRPITAEEAGRFGMTEEQAAEAQERGDIRFSLRSAPTTPEFKRWFGDSKVVDEDGKPLVVYHGSPVADITEFRGGKTAYGIFFSDSEYSAAYYNPKANQRNVKAGDVYEVYLKADKVADLRKSSVLKRILDEAGRSDEFDAIEEAISRGDMYAYDSKGRVQDEIVQTAESMGFDAVILPDATSGEIANSYIVFKPTQIKSATGNIGTYDVTNPDIRKSLRSTLPASAVRAMDKIAPPRYNPGFAERIMNAVSGDTFTSIRQKLINRYEALASVDRRVAKMLKQMGGAPQLAGSRAETAALMSDLGAGVLEAAMGVHNGIGGAPIYRNGVTTVSDYNGTVKGLLEIFKPIAAMKDADAFRMYQTWAAVKRGVRLDAEGREDLITAADVRSINDLRRSNPDLIKTFESVQKDWIAYNNALVKYQVDTGVLSPEMAKEWTKHGDYFPFYRLMEGEDIAGPKVFSSIGNVSRGKKLKGGENPLGDFFENIVRNSQAAIQAGMKNIAAQTATKQALMLQEVTRLTHKPQAHESVYRVYENGKEVYYKAHDPLFIEAIKALNMADIPFMGLLAKPAAMLRNLVTKDPAFMLANMMRDSLSAWTTSGVKMTPVIDTLRNFGSAIAGKSPELNALYAAGVLGGYDYARGTKQSAEVFEKTLRRRSGKMTPFEVGTKPFTSLWEALEKGTQASDAATRMEVYKRTLAATGNELEALSAALEVMNFNRKGNSAIIRILTAAVPFLNARIQGLDILFRTAIMPFGGSATDQARQRMKTFWVRGMTIMALSSMYWLLTHDDDEYKKQEQETRDNYWLIPSLGVKIPIPFEVGVMFKVVPERLMQLSFGTDTTKDFTDSMKRQLVSTFAFNPIPQVVLPAYEVKTNHSFFTDRPIIGKGLENVADKYQVGPSTSRVAQLIGDSVNYSPMKIDHLIKGYTGTIGSYASDLFDMMYDMGADAPKASKRFEQMPVIKRFLVDPEARGTVTAYYKLKDDVDQAVRTTNLLERSNNFEEGTKYTLENLRLLATDDYVKDIEKDMKDYREMRQQIMASPMSADTKRDLLLNINRMESLTTKNIQSIKKFAQ